MPAYPLGRLPWPRRTPSPRAAVVAAILLLVLVAAAPAHGEETRSFSKSFSASSTETLGLANLAGRIEIANGSGDQVVVRATVHAEGRDAAETRRLLDSMSWVKDTAHPGGWALSYPVREYSRFRYPAEKGFGWFGGMDNTRYLGRRVTISGGGGGPVLYADLQITYPPSAGLTVRSAVGAVRGGDLYGRLSIDTGSADVTLGDFNGDLDVDTGSGDVRVAGLRGKGNLDTGSGDVEVGRLDADELRADTGSGDVKLGGAGPGGRVGKLVADTGSGDVQVLDVAVVTADLDTGSGDVLLRGSLAGARSIRADTGSGDVEIYGGPDASFHAVADQGSGDLRVGYADAELHRDGRKVIGADRGDRRTRIVIDTGSGDAVLAPAG